ncbi:MAG: YafY family transcriptional regulator [Tomitella sp.]|nr:YafY family transcriptional regulator [Tomitella sp.]
MADTTARALQLLELLQSAQMRTVAEIADRLGVDERTVRRDAKRLHDLGVPVETLRGRYGGYRLAPGQRVLPLMFSDKEAVALVLGLARAQSATRDPEIAEQTALAKIKRALPAAEAARVERLLAVMTRTPRQERIAPDPGMMLTLAEGVDRRRVLDLRYLSRGNVSTRREVHPYGLVTHSGRWYLVAFDLGRQEERTFRVDRIRTARLLSTTFAPSQRPAMGGHLLDVFADAEYQWQVVLRIQGTEEHIRAHLPLSVARLERLGREADGPSEGALPWYRAEIHAESLDWLPSVIAALGCEVVIERPDELRDRVRTAAAQMLHAADERPTKTVPQCSRCSDDQ